MKTVCYWIIRILIYLLEFVLVWLLWLPVRLIWGANTIRYIIAPESSLAEWMGNNLKS